MTKTMDIKAAKNDAETILEKYQIPETAIYMLGLFDDGVTVLSQQKRALNLVWALVESETLAIEPADASGGGTPLPSIAIVGGGFSGLTVAAGLITKGFKGRIAIFEQRDTLLPLQHGSDTRWLHPNIYDWPAPGSEVNSAMLPIMNWTAARASDVAVQSIANWLSITEDCDNLELYCNARHVRVDPRGLTDRHPVEWAGERRDKDGTTLADGERAARGRTDMFDHVILATGYGLESGKGISYWRNDMSGQPSLERARRTYIVSGQGDGAMIDLLRLKISNFRQDRILFEMFGSTGRLRDELEQIKASFDPTNPTGFVDRLMALQRSCPDDFSRSMAALQKRLRRDTEVSLATRVTKISDLLESPKIRISFQNRVLVYFLYLCGGFFPVDTAVSELAADYSVPKDRIITRHGIDRDRMLRNVLHSSLADDVLSLRKSGHFIQDTEFRWTGGYFDTRGSSGFAASRPDTEKAKWRREYLPGPTKLVATTFCSSIEAFLRKNFSGDRLRVTLHRAMRFGKEEVLQQCCEYFGKNDDPVPGSPGRTFPATNGTIGAAYQSGQIIMSTTTDNAKLNEAMAELKLDEASRKMSESVGFLLAIPIIEPLRHTSPSAVAAVLFVDAIGHLSMDDERLKDLVRLTQAFVDALEKTPDDPLEGIYNARMSEITSSPATPAANPILPAGLEFVDRVPAPRSKGPFQLNFETSDFIPVKTS